LTWESCGGARRKNEAGKAANRAERASNLPRREKDHAFGLKRFDERNRIRVLDNNIDEQGANTFPGGVESFDNATKGTIRSPVRRKGPAKALSGDKRV